MTTATDTGDRRSPIGWIALALVLGLALGLILAWRVWPARWVETDPSDLRAAHQQTYVILVADSYSVTGDPNQARERLYELVDDDTDWAAVDQLIAATADALEQEGDAAAALRVRRMRENVPLPLEPSAAPLATQEPEEEVASASPRWALVLVGLGLVALVIALVIWLISSEMRKREPAAGYEPAAEHGLAPDRQHIRPGRALALDPVPGPGDLGIAVAQPTERELPAWDEASFMVEEDEDEAEFDMAKDQEDLLEAELEEEAWDEEDEGLEDEAWDDEEEEERPLGQQPDLAVEEAWHVEESPAAAPEEAQETVVRTVDLPDLEEEDLELVQEPEAEQEALEEEAQLAAFEATYRFGDDDFYHAFTIESPAHDFLGQCGIVISDVLGIEDAQLVDAFDLWLFETRGTRTVSKVLASEYAYTDDDLSAKLARKGEVLLAEEGLVVTLETETLRLIATIRELAYRDDQAQPDSVFDHLEVDMVVERVGA